MSQGNHAFGLSFNATSYTDVRNLDNVLTSLAEDALKDVESEPLLSYEMNNTKINALAFADIKLSYGAIISKRSFSMLMVGLSIKKYSH